MDILCWIIHPDHVKLLINPLFCSPFLFQILLVMVDSIAKLSQDVKDKDLVYSILLVLSGMLMDEKGEIIYCSVLYTFSFFVVTAANLMHIIRSSC